MGKLKAAAALNDECKTPDMSQKTHTSQSQAGEAFMSVRIVVMDHYQEQIMSLLIINIYIPFPYCSTLQFIIVQSQLLS